MSSSEFNLMENLELIKPLVSSKSIGNLEQIEQSVTALYAKLDLDNRELATKVFSRLIQSLQNYVPEGNSSLLYELAKVYLPGDYQDGFLFQNAEESHIDNGLQQEMNKLLELLKKYSSLCDKMKCVPKNSLKKDLVLNGNLGQCVKKMDLSAQQYAELSNELHRFVE